MPYKDKNKAKERNARYYQEHKEEFIAYSREYHQEHKEEINAANREAYQNDPEYKAKKDEINRKSNLKNRDKRKARERTGHRRFKFTQSYAKRRNLSFTLGEELYTGLINSPCDYCEDQLGKVSTSTGVGLDRLDNSKGYDLGNVVPCCFICNRARGDHFTPEETKIAVRAVIEFRKNKKE